MVRRGLPASATATSTTSTSKGRLLFTPETVQGPWKVTRFSLGSCSNPTATFHRNGTLMYVLWVLCYDQAFSMYRIIIDRMRGGAARSGVPPDAELTGLAG